MIADKAFTMAALRSMANESIVLPTIRDALTIRVREEGKRKYSMDFVVVGKKWRTQNTH